MRNTYTQKPISLICRLLRTVAESSRRRSPLAVRRTRYSSVLLLLVFLSIALWPGASERTTAADGRRAVCAITITILLYFVPLINLLLPSTSPARTEDVGGCVADKKKSKNDVGFGGDQTAATRGASAEISDPGPVRLLRPYATVPPAVAANAPSADGRFGP